MNNGVSITKDDKGFLVDSKTLIGKEEAQKVLSEYFFFDYWEDKEIDAFQGELNKDVMFLQAVFGDSCPVGLCVNRFSYFTDVKFGAGYLKYVMLGDLAYTLLTPKGELDEVYKLHNIDEVLETAEQNRNDNYEIIEKVKYIISLCNRVFIEDNIINQKEYLMHAAKEFNDYCENYIHKKTGRCDFFEVFSEPEKAKNEILEYLYIPKEKQQLERVFLKDEWTEEDKNIVQNVIDSII